MPTYQFHPNVVAMQPSATLAMTARAKSLKREGKPIIGLSAGEPDFDTPAPIVEAGIKALREGAHKYTENAGLLELRQGIAEKLQRDNGLTYTPEQILCSNGAKQSVAMAIFALVRPGDEVLIPAPYWVSYPEMVRLAGGIPVVIEATAATEYKVTPEQVDAAITPNTRLFIHNSPSNPTGAVYTPEETAALAAVFAKHEHVFLLSDEIYEYVIFDAQHVSLAAYEGLYDRTVTINGFSKGYAMTGWRLGYMAAPLPIIKACDKIQSQFTSAPATVSQKAGVAALQMDPSYITTMVDAFRARRDRVMELLREIPGLITPKPEGAFYLYPDVSAYFGTESNGRVIDSANELAMYLLERYHVALVPGEGFGSANGLRISYAASMEELEEAMSRIQAGFSALSPAAY